MGWYGVLGGFGRDRRGGLAVVAAVTIMLVVIATGVAIDYIRLARVHAEVQAALDAAVVTAIADASPDRVAKARDAVRANIAVDARRSTDAVDIVADATGRITGRANGTVPTTFTGLFGVAGMRFAVTSSAEPRKNAVLASVTMKTLSAKGMLQKEIYLVTHDDAGNVTSRQLLLQYLLSYRKDKSVAQTFKPPIGKTIKLDGESYRNVSIEMHVYRNKVYDFGNKYVYSSSATAAASYLRTTGECWDEGGMTMYWEDSTDGDYKDFVGVFSCTLPATSITGVRLSS